MQFQSRQYGDIVVATPAGRLDHLAASAFELGLLPLAKDRQAAGMVVDFSGVDYISSVGLRVLMIAAKEMRARKARIAAVGLQSIVAEIFAISRFDSVFEIHPSLRDALAAMSPDALAAYDTAAAPGA